MLFNSFYFLCFFIIVTALFFTLPQKLKWLLLLLASCTFYMFFYPPYILILFITIIIDYFAGIYIEKEQDSKRKKRFLIISIIANVGMLAFFKYYNFFNENLTVIFHVIGFNNPIPYLQILLPIGLSFHTFQAMSYTIEVYRGNQKAEHHLGIYSLYVMFYPQLVAGPIERPQNIIHQLKEDKFFKYVDVVEGLKLMAWGFFKKLVIADRLSIYVNTIYGSSEYHNSTSIIIAAVFFSFQIYCDFSGYSDIALGSARVMGYRLMTNFDNPYASKTILEFWKKWHISLSSWFRDYVYIPLGGNRVSTGRFYFNTFAIFLLSGLWHGANWTFIVWGCIHGFFVIVTNTINKKLGVTKNSVVISFFKIVFTFSIVTLAWIFFRANSMQQAITILTGIAKCNFQMPYIGSSAGLVYSFFGIAFLLLVDNICLKSNAFKKSTVMQYSFYLLLVIMILLIGVFDQSSFIYFQF